MSDIATVMKGGRFFAKGQFRDLCFQSLKRAKTKKQKQKVVRMTFVFFCPFGSLNHHFVLNGRIKVNNVWNGMRVRKVEAEFSFLAKFLQISR